MRLFSLMTMMMMGGSHEKRRRAMDLTVLVLAALTVLAPGARATNDAHEANADSSAALSWSLLLPRWLQEEVSASAPPPPVAAVNAAEFAKFNEEIQSVRLVLDDPPPLSTTLLFEFRMSMSNIYCSQAAIGNLRGAYRQVNASTLLYGLAINPYSLTCFADYEYSYGFLFRSEGTAQLTMSNNALELGFGFTTPPSAESGFETPSVPNATWLDVCRPTVAVNDLQVSGQIDQLIVTIFRQFLINSIEGSVADVLCQEVRNGFDFMQDLLTGLNEQLEPYVQDEQDASALLSDPLGPERDYFVVRPSHSSGGLTTTTASTTSVKSSTPAPEPLVSLGRGTAGGLMSQALDQVDDLLGRMVKDDSRRNGDSENIFDDEPAEDLAINVFLRNNILDDGGYLTLDLTSTEEPDGIVLMDSHDDILELQLALKSIQFGSLDTLTEFNAVEQLGNYTVGNGFGWQALDLQLQLQITAGVSQLPSSQFETAPDQPVRAVEHVTVSLQLQDLDLSAALFVAFPQAAADAWPVGNLLQAIEPAVDCLLQAVDQVVLSSLHLQIADFTDTTMQGLGSPGFDVWFTSLLQAGMVMYKPTLLQVLPAAVDDLRRTVNDWLNDPDQRSEAVANLIDGLELENGEDETNSNDNAPAAVVESRVGPTVESAASTATAASSSIDNTNTCPLPTPTAPGAMLDFRDLLLPREEALEYGATGQAPYGEILATVWSWISSELQRVDVDTGKAAINDWIIAPLTEDQSGTAGDLIWSGDLINERQRLDIIGASFQLRVYDLQIQNLDSIGPSVTLLDPVPDQAHVLDNGASIGVDEPLQIGAKVEFGLFTAAENIVNSVDIVMGVRDLDLGLTVLLRMMEESILTFPLKDINKIDCWLATLPQPTLNYHGVRTKDSKIPYELLDVTNAFESLQFDIECIHCDSPQVQDMAELLSTDRGIQGAAKAVDEIFELVVDIFGSDYMELLLDRRLVQARERCPHRPEYNPNAVGRDYAPFEAPTTEDSIEFVLALAFVAILMIVAVTIVLLVVRIIVRRRHRRWLDTLCERRVHRLWKAQQQAKERATDVNAQTTSLFNSKDIPWIVRYVIPLIILGNIGLFISGHMSPAGSVSIFLSFAGETIEQEDFFEFSIASGTVHIWKQGGKELAILILAASGAWPYAKQLISFVAWFLPPRILPSATRGNVYRWLDALAKWSMIDVFTILISLVGFRVAARSPDLDFLPDNFYSLDLLVIPKLGLYANFIAQVVSQISSHVIIHYHDNVVRVAKKRLSTAHEMARQRTIVTDGNLSDEANSSTNNSEQATGQDQEPTATREVEESLCQHAYARPHRGENERLVARHMTTPFLVFAGVLLSLLIVLGCALPSFSLELLGIVAVFVEAGQRFSEATVDFSLFYMMKMLVNQADFTDKTADYIGLGLFAALLLVTVMLVPLVQTALLLYHWLCPMTRTRRKRLIIANEMLQAWQYAEVFALSILAGTWQLGAISDFMVNVYCEEVAELRALFGLLNYVGLLDNDDSQCFRVRATIENAFFCLAAGALVLAFLNTFVKRAATQYLRDKELQDDSVTFSSKECAQIDVAKAKANIDPPPQLFTDRFRWFLVGSSLPMESYLQIFSSSSMGRSGEKERAVVALNDDSDYIDATAANRSLSPSAASDNDDAGEAMPAMVTADDSLMEDDVYIDAPAVRAVTPSLAAGSYQLPERFGSDVEPPFAAMGTDAPPMPIEEMDDGHFSPSSTNVRSGSLDEIPKSLDEIPKSLSV